MDYYDSNLRAHLRGSEMYLLHPLLGVFKINSAGLLNLMFHHQYYDEGCFRWAVP